MVFKTGIQARGNRANTFRADTQLVAASAIYLIAVLVANYTATWFIPLPVFGFVAVGTLIFGVTFTQRDRVHRGGRMAVYTMIIVAAAMSVVMAFTLGVPLRIIAASFTAITLAEVADTEIYQLHITKPWLERVARSNAVSIPLDSVLFNAIAFAGVFALPMWIAIVFGEIVVKTLTGVVAALCHQP